MVNIRRTEGRILENLMYRENVRNNVYGEY